MTVTIHKLPANKWFFDEDLDRDEAGSAQVTHVIRVPDDARLLKPAEYDEHVVEIPDRPLTLPRRIDACTLLTMAAASSRHRELMDWPAVAITLTII